MSGLAVVFERDGRPAEPDLVGRMLNAAPYRGPDGSNVMTLGSVSMGQSQMDITVEDRWSVQPFVGRTTGCVIVADARIDNRGELLTKLRLAGSTPISDVALILASYEAWGRGAFPELLGDFAVVIWDPRERVIIAARDTSGQRSLYYRADPHSFIAASEIHQLFADPRTPIAADDQAIQDFLVPLNVYVNEKDSAGTFFRGVRSVRAGHMLVVSREAVSETEYWSLSPVEIRHPTAEGYAEHYRSLLADAIRDRVRSVGPVGAQLSGGLDSSSIVCLAQHMYRQGEVAGTGFRAFSVTFGGLDCDERPFIRAAQEMYGFAVEELPFQPRAAWLQLRPSGFLDGPNLGNVEVRRQLFGAVTRAGIRTLLTGDVADACISGSPMVFDSLLRAGRFSEFWRRLRAYRASSNEPLRRTLAFSCVAPFLPMALHRGALTMHYRRVCAALGIAMLPTWMPTELRVRLAERQRQLGQAQIADRRFSNPARESEYRMLYPPEVARHPAPWPVVMARPFADRRLHAFLLGIPPELKFDPSAATTSYGASKQLHRKALVGILPEVIRTRTTKPTFAAAFSAELAKNWPDFEGAFGPKGRARVAQAGYVDGPRFWSRLQAARDGTPQPDDLYLWCVFGLETWLRSLELPRTHLLTIPLASSLRSATMPKRARVAEGAHPPGASAVLTQ